MASEHLVDYVEDKVIYFDCSNTVNFSRHNKEINQPRVGTLNKYILSKSSILFTIKARYKSLNAQEKQMTVIVSAVPWACYAKLV